MQELEPMLMQQGTHSLQANSSPDGSYFQIYTATSSATLTTTTVTTASASHPHKSNFLGQPGEPKFLIPPMNLSNFNRQGCESWDAKNLHDCDLDSRAESGPQEQCAQMMRGVTLTNPSRGWPTHIPQGQSSFMHELHAAPGFAHSTPAATGVTLDQRFSALTSQRKLQDRYQRELPHASPETAFHPPWSTLPVTKPETGCGYDEGPTFLPLSHSTPKEAAIFANEPPLRQKMGSNYSPWVGAALSQGLLSPTEYHSLTGLDDGRLSQGLAPINQPYFGMSEDERLGAEANLDQPLPQVASMASADQADLRHRNSTPMHQPPQMATPYPIPLHQPFPQAFLGPNLDHSKGPTFNGKTNFQDFVVQFDSIAQIKRWTYEIKGQRLLMALEGQATSVLPTLPPTSRTDYASLRAALEKRFNPQLDPDLAGNMAQNRRRKKGETFVAFAQELKRMMIATYENWPPDRIERLAREQFFNSIDDPQLKGLLWSRSPCSVEEAAMMADGLEKLIELPSTRHPNQAVYTNQHDQIMDPKNSAEGKGKREKRKSGSGINKNRKITRGNGHSETALHPGENRLPAGNEQQPQLHELPLNQRYELTGPHENYGQWEN